VPYWTLTDGVPLHYVDHGRGPVLFFVPGWTFTSEVWQRQIDALSDRFRVISCDLRGAGRSGKSAVGHTFSGYASDVAELLQGLQVCDATVVGWAMGATVAARLALTADSVSRLVWVDHSPSFFAAPDWPFALYGNLTPEVLDETLALLSSDRRQATEALLDDIFALGIEPDDRAAFSSAVFQTPTDLAVRLLAAVAWADLRPWLGQITQPCLFVNGAQSVVPPGVGAWLASQVADGDAVLLDQAAHAPFWDKPDEFNSAVAAFATATSGDTRA
jgi:pimeloyl-ACP methyl ester carboxylesterase